MDNRTIEEIRNNETELINKIEELEHQLDYLRSGEYLNQLRFERDMLQDVVDDGYVSDEDKDFIDMIHRNTELLEENKKLIAESTEWESKCYDLQQELSKYREKSEKNINRNVKAINYIEEVLKNEASIFFSREYFVDLLKILEVENVSRI